MPIQNNLTNFQYVVNFMNACIGIGILAKPYAIAISGWHSVLSICIAFLLVTYTEWLIAKITVNTFDISDNTVSDVKEDDDVRMLLEESEDEKSNIEIRTENINTAISIQNKNPFQAMGYKAMGIYGEYYVNIVILLKMIEICISTLIIEWEITTQTLEYLFTSKNEHIAMYLTEQYLFIYLI
eukprot:65703_1